MYRIRDKHDRRLNVIEWGKYCENGVAVSCSQLIVSCFYRMKDLSKDDKRQQQIFYMTLKNDGSLPRMKLHLFD
jgi:hypothetical protein